MRTLIQKDCPHTTVRPTGEMRPTAGCKKRKATVTRPVLKCVDCGLHFVVRNGQRRAVPPSATFAQALQAVRQGLTTGKAAAAQHGNFSDEERDALDAAEPCEHRYEPIILVYRCADCGKLKQERVKVGAPPE
jgi:hypothetical protein